MRDYLAKIKETVTGLSATQAHTGWVLLIGCVVVYMQHAWLPGFFQDGYLYASLGKNAAELGHWLVPYQSDTQFREFAEHPPLLFMLEGVFFKIFGSDFTQARIFSGLWGVLSVLGIFGFLKCRRNIHWAFYSGLILLLSPAFMKKVRFPGMDIPLTFFFIASLYFYYLAFEKRNEKNYKQWLLSGIFFGIALWMKGLPALIIPFIIFIHLIFSGAFLGEIKKWAPYAGLLLGLGIFGLWPLCLKFSGKYHVFDAYLNRQLFGTVIKGRGQEEIEFFAYVINLLKTAFPWLILSIISTVHFVKNKIKDPLFLLFLVWFLSVLIPLSFMKFKYSHYILPLYPALAGMAGYWLSERKTSFHQWSGFVTKGLVVLAGLILLVFPLTNKSKRHPELLEIAKKIDKLENIPKTWIVVNEAYPYWAVSGFASYRYGGNPKWLKRPRVLATEPAVIFINSKDYSLYKIPHWTRLYDSAGLHVGIFSPKN